MTADLERRTYYRGFRQVLILRLNRVNPQRDRARHLVAVRIGHIEKHHTALAASDFGKVTRQRGQLHHPGHRLFLDGQHLALPAGLVVLRWIHHLHRLNRRRLVPRVRELHRERQVRQPVRCFYRIHLSPADATPAARWLRIQLSVSTQQRLKIVRSIAASILRKAGSHQNQPSHNGDVQARDCFHQSPRHIPKPSQSPARRPFLIAAIYHAELLDSLGALVHAALMQNQFRRLAFVVGYKRDLRINHL